MKIHVINQAKVPSSQIEFLKSWCQKIQRELKKQGFGKSLQNKNLTIVFLESAAAKKINLQFRKRDYATDVLSFDSFDSASLGELVLCWPVLKKQAVKHGHSIKFELGYMVLHGILHLLGFEHEKNEADAIEMFRLQDQIFEDISIQYVNRSRSPSGQKKNPRSRTARS
jgi:probable rRNA maturation factor